MSEYRIGPCRLVHLRELALTMRAADRAEIERAGFAVRHALAALWRGSIAPKAALVDGMVAAAWGDNAPLLARRGSIWLFTAPPIERLPLAFFRETRRELAERLRVRESLHADVAADYAAAIRFFGMLGFEFANARPVGPDGVLYRRMTIRRAPLEMIERAAA